MQRQKIKKDTEGTYILCNNGRTICKRYVVVKKCITCGKSLYFRRYQKIPQHILCKEHRSGKYSVNWKGGRVVTFHGYVLLHKPNHWSSNSQGYVKEHRYIIEKKICRKLKFREKVHHINGNKQDNSMENLELCKNERTHRQRHLKKRKCEYVGCNRIHYGKGFCQMHYQRYRLNILKEEK